MASRFHWASGAGADYTDYEKRDRGRPSEMRCARHGHEFHGVKRSEERDGWIGWVLLRERMNPCERRDGFLRNQGWMDDGQETEGREWN